MRSGHIWLFHSRRTPPPNTQEEDMASFLCSLPFAGGGGWCKGHVSPFTFRLPVRSFSEKKRIDNYSAGNVSQMKEERKQCRKPRGGKNLIEVFSFSFSVLLKCMKLLHHLKKNRCSFGTKENFSCSEFVRNKLWDKHFKSLGRAVCIWRFITLTGGQLSEVWYLVVDWIIQCRATFMYPREKSTCKFFTCFNFTCTVYQRMYLYLQWFVSEVMLNSMQRIRSEEIVNQ